MIFTDRLVEAEKERADEYGEPRMPEVLFAAKGGAGEVRRQVMS